MVNLFDHNYIMIFQFTLIFLIVIRGILYVDIIIFLITIHLLTLQI